MIRSATFQDVPRVEELLREMYEVSKYRGRVEISAKAMRDRLLYCLNSQRRPFDGGTNFDVAVRAGRVVGFMIGHFQRVYLIGNKLVAQDVFFYVSPNGGQATDSWQLLDSFVEWGRANPRVIEIDASWADTLPGADRLPALLKRKGFELCGEIYEMRLDVAPAGEVRAA